MFADLDESAAREAAGETGAAFWGDLANEETAAQLVAKTVETLGAPAILVNNAGGGILRPFLGHTLVTMSATIDRNLWTAIWCRWEALHDKRWAGGGRAIHTDAERQETQSRGYGSGGWSHIREGDK